MFTIKHIHEIHFVDGKTDEWKEKLFREIQSVNQILKKMSVELDNLTTEVSETKTVMASAVTLLQGLKQRLDEAGTDKVKLKALSDDLDTNTNALATAIAANTPAEETGNGEGNGEGGENTNG